MRVYVTNDLVVKYHPNWPVEPDYVKGILGHSRVNEVLYEDYQKAIEKAVEEAVSFPDQDAIMNMLYVRYGSTRQSTASPATGKLKSGFYEIEGFKYPPLSSGEKEEQKRTISSVCRAWTKRDIVQLTIKDMENFEASKLSSVDTNIEEKKKDKEIEWLKTCIKWNEMSFKELLEKNYLLSKEIERLKSTRPVQEKPDFQQAAIDLMGEFKNGVTKIPGYDWHVGCVDHYGLKSALEKFWKNYVDKQPKV